MVDSPKGAFAAYDYVDTKASGSGGRKDSPRPGRTVFLFNNAEYKENQNNPGHRTVTAWTCLYQPEVGGDPEKGEGCKAAPQSQGEKVEVTYFLSDRKGAPARFWGDMKTLSNTLAGISEGQEMMLADMLLPVELPEGCEDEDLKAEVASNKKLFGDDDLARLKASGTKLLGMVTAQDGESPAFDNNVVVEIVSKKDAYHPLIDNKKSRDDENNWVRDKDGPVIKYNTRHYLNDQVSVDEIKANMDEKDIIRCFGSKDAWEQFCEFNDSGE